MTGYADKKLDLIEAIELELRGPRMTEAALRDVQKYCQNKNAKQAELLRTASQPVIKAKPKREVKNGWHTEIRTIRNRANGTTYQWKYSQLYKDGKRVKGEGTCKSLGRVK